MKEQSATMIKITETTVRGDEHEAPVDRTFQTADEAKEFLKDRLTEWYEEQGFGTEDAESESEEAWTRRGIFVTLREDGVVREAFRKADKVAPPEALEPFGVPRARELTSAIRRLYRQWDAGKLTDQEFLDKAHVVNDDYEVLFAHGKVSDEDEMRYHDEYTSSIMAVTDIVI